MANSLHKFQEVDNFDGWSDRKQELKQKIKGLIKLQDNISKRIEVVLTEINELFKNL